MSSYLPPPSRTTEPLPTTYPTPTSYFSSSFDDSGSDSSTSTFGIIIGVFVGILGLIILFAIWYKWLRKKSDCSKYICYLC
ncbi:hypothetical protein VNO78_09649 [Psophocarpus tetragonolobus]|uniref:Uncharacterized protein n=1 Tax=Psophocarpus tetragonolobus TaxID=3891 RepID=A0AAN9T6Y0_PSOTE